MFRLIAVGLGIVSLLAFANPASAHIIFCNQFSQDIFVALVYEQFDRGDKHLGWLGRGWLTVRPNECNEFDSAIAVSEFYWRAETNLYKAGDKMHRYNWPGPDKGEKYFWDVTDNFQLNNAERRPLYDKPLLSAYLKSALSASGPINVEITFTKEGDTATSYAGFK